MRDVFIQSIVLGLAVVAAGIKSVRFEPSSVTDFELARRVKSGDEMAMVEQHMRHDRPLLLALRRLTIVLTTVFILTILIDFYEPVFVVLWAAVWLLMIELLQARARLRRLARQQVKRYWHYIVKTVEMLKPLLRLMAGHHTISVVQPFYTRDEFLQLLERDAKVLSHPEKQAIRHALAYRTKYVRDIMTPCSRIVSVAKSETIGPVLLDRLHKSGHSTFPVIAKDVDHVVGIVDIHNLVPLNPKFKRASDAMQPPVFYVHQDQPLDHLLQAFLRTRPHLFIVVNELKETTGVVTLEDLLQTIIGRKIVDDFNQYEDLRAVASLATTAPKESNPGQQVNNH